MMSKLLQSILRWIALLLVLVLLLPLCPVESEAATPETDRIIVSLGDSYSSGEGIEPFYSQDLNIEKKAKIEDWYAHRSEKSWPGMLKLNGVSGTMAQNRGENWYFMASAGAKIEHLDNEQLRPIKRDGVERTGHVQAQLKIFADLEAQGKKADYVTVTIGGNDVNFAGIVKTVAYNGLLNKPNALQEQLDDLWETFEKTTRKKLSDAYDAICAAAGPQATVLVVGYPTLFASDGSGFFPSKKEAGLVNDAVRDFNDELEKLVKECRDRGNDIWFVSVEEQFAGHEADTNEPYIRAIKLGTAKQDLDSSKPYSDYSMHPNEEGAAAYAECVQEAIDEHEKRKGFDQLKIPVKSLSRLVVKENGQIIEEYNFHYSGDLLTHIDVSHPVSEMSGTLRFSYDSAGRVTDVDNGGLLALYSDRSYTYDSNGNPTDVKIYWYGATSPTEQYTYEYDPQGELSSAKVYYANPDTGTADHSITYTYTNTYENGKLTEQCRTVKWIDEDYRIICPFGEFYGSEMLALTRYSYNPEGLPYTEKFVEIPNSMYDPGGNHPISDSDWHTTTYNYAYAPVVLMGSQDSHQLVIYDRAMTGLWSVYFGDASYVMDKDHYISKVTSKDMGYTYELTFVD